MKRPPRILVTLDGSHLAEAALPIAARLAAGLNADVTLLHVVAPPRYYEVPPIRDVLPLVDLEERQADEALATYAAQFPGRHVERVVLVGTRASDEIVEYLRGHHVDFVIMATHGHGGLRHLIAGSVTEAVVRSGVAPVIAVRPVGTPAAAVV